MFYILAIDPPARPDRGGCDVPIKKEPAEMPAEAPVPIKLPDNAPIEVPNWPTPAKKPAEIER